MDNVRALVIDDDVLAARMLCARLGAHFPVLRVDATTDPNSLGSYDIYLIDNDFDGRHLGTTLARRIRQEHPDALVIAFSGTLDARVLKDLLNAGCHGACDKGDDEDFQTLVDLIRRFVSEGSDTQTRKGGFLGVLRSMTDLLRQWNQRLEKLETR